MRSIQTLILGLICVHVMVLPAALAQTNSYKQTNLVSDTQGVAPHMDAKLVNPWGIGFFPGNPFWISDNNSGYSTLYNQNGASPAGAPANVGPFPIPAPLGSSNPSTPTGIVANLSQTGFEVNQKPSLFVFDTEDGTISGWNGTDPVTLKIDHSKAGAVYKGLALITNNLGSFLLVADFNCGCVDVLDSAFNAMVLSGTFTDPTLPAGYAPFGIHVINNQVLVTYALQDQLKHDPVHQVGAGYVDLFDLNGNFVRRVVSQGMLNAPWGAVIPPANFGAFGGKLLIGNFGDGTINAYDFTSGNFIGQLKDSTGASIINTSLWDMVFGGGGPSGDPNTMYITAGLANEQHGLFAAITANAAPPPPSANFNISATPSMLTISAGQPASFMVTLGGLNGFNSAVNLTCSGQPAGSSCSFSPASVSPASGGTATTMLTIATSASPYRVAGAMAKNASGGIFAALLPVPALGFLGLLVAGTGRKQRLAGTKWMHYLAGSLGLLLATAFLFASSGCGGSMNNGGTGTQRGMATVVITGTSGNLSHSTSVSLTVQ